jgi:cytochrome oxidase Cu insertion factor (SCO1/SenC/PrrC family)
VRQQEPLRGDLMSRPLAAGLLIIVAILNSTTAQTRTGAKPIGIGEAAPDFALVDHHGIKVTLSDSKGKSLVVLVFYRGYW